MESSRSKEQRLMISPDVPARFESLNDDTLTTTLQFVGDKSYKSFGGINKHCRKVYLNTEGMTKKTFLYGYGTLQAIVQDITDKMERPRPVVYDPQLAFFGKGVVLYNRDDVLDWTLQERKTYLLRGICGVAAEEKRLDILEEVLNNLEDEDDKISIFRHVEHSATQHGKLEVLKWVETKGLFVFQKETCAFLAVQHGQLHIMKWLQEEKGFEFQIGSFHVAIRGGHFHVMRWFREQGFPWDEITFKYAAEYTTNLEVLQWLHDEGCPWPENYGVGRRRLKPEVIHWCHMNGYGDRIYNF